MSHLPKDCLPKDCEPVVVDIKKVYQFKHYKPNSQQAKKGIIGRWQEFNGYGWDNCPDPRDPVGPLPKGGAFVTVAGGVITGEWEPIKEVQRLILRDEEQRREIARLRALVEGQGQ